MNTMLKNSLTESKFAMWRACMAVIHLDGKVTAEEKAWAEGKINNIPFSEDQKNILISDLEGAIELSGVIANVTDKKDKAFLLHMVRTIGFLDGDFSASEKRAFQKLEGAILNNLDLKSIHAEITQMEKESYELDTVYKQMNEHSLLEKMYRGAQKFSSGGDYKYPDEE
jgi:hypothetical protein